MWGWVKRNMWPDAVRLYYALLAYTLGFVAWELPRAHAADPAEYARRWRRSIATTSPATSFMISSG